MITTEYGARCGIASRLNARNNPIIIHRGFSSSDALPCLDIRQGISEGARETISYPSLLLYVGSEFVWIAVVNLCKGSTETTSTTAVSAVSYGIHLENQSVIVRLVTPTFKPPFTSSDKDTSPATSPRQGALHFTD